MCTRWGKIRVLSATWQKMIVPVPTSLAISGYHGCDRENSLDDSMNKMFVSDFELRWPFESRLLVD